MKVFVAAVFTIVMAVFSTTPPPIEVGPCFYYSGSRVLTCHYSKLPMMEVGVSENYKAITQRVILLTKDYEPIGYDLFGYFRKDAWVSLQMVDLKGVYI